MKKAKHSNQIDMLNGPLWSKILLFALPLAASSVLQQLFNAADVAVVGKFAGSEALAAVGGNTPVINLLINLFVGISVGVNVVIAHYVGQGKKKEVEDTVHTAIVMALASGFVLIFAGMFLAEPILRLMGTPQEVLPLAVLYLRIYFAGMPFLMFYNFGAAILRSVGDTKRPLYCLMFSGLLNVALNLLLVIVFKMSVAGVGIATVVSNAVSAGLVFYFLTHEEEPIRLNLRKLAVSAEHLKRVLRIGLPAGIQSMIFSLSNVCIQSGVNSFGAEAIAGAAAAVNFEFFGFFVTNAFSQATMTFTSQNMGAGRFDRCKSVYRLSMVFAMLTTGIMAVCFILGREYLVQIYSSDPVVIDYAIRRMEHAAAFIWLMSTYDIASAGLRGMGYSVLPMVLTVIGCCGFRVLWIFTVFKMFYSFETLMNVYPVSWIVTGLMVVPAYLYLRRKKWRMANAQNQTM